MEKSEFKKKILWFIVFLVLVIFTIYAVVAQSSSFSFAGFIKYISNSKPEWIIASVLCMIGFVVFEGISLNYMSGFFGCKKKYFRGTVYSAADIYFSAITPSATGGQPASAYFMISDGIPTSVTAMVLVMNLMMYTISILVIGAVCFIFRPSIFMAFDRWSRILIVLGLVIQSACVVMFLLLIFKEKITFKIVDLILSILNKFHLVKNVEKKRNKLKIIAKEYKQCAGSVKNHAGMVFKVFMLNLLQRVSQIGVTVCVYIGVGGKITNFFDVMVTQGFVVLGSNAVPIPGSVGVADYLFLNGFRTLIPKDTVSVELLSRGISFYSCLILCGIVTMVSYIADINRKRNKVIGKC